jgi:hypothetical protein
MISLILLVQYLVEALNEPRVQPEEDNPESNATGRAKCGQSGEGNPDRGLLRTAPAARWAVRPDGEPLPR